MGFFFFFELVKVEVATNTEAAKFMGTHSRCIGESITKCLFLATTVVKILMRVIDHKPPARKR